MTEKHRVWPELTIGLGPKGRAGVAGFLSQGTEFGYATGPDVRQWTVRTLLGVALLSLLGLTLTAPSPATGSTPQGSPVAGTSCRVFPANSYWHAEVSRLPAHPRSREWLSHMSSGVRLHPDFGPSYGDGPDYGIPVTVVSGTHARVRVGFDYAAESDRVGYPFGPDTRIEGGRNSGGDMHAVVVQRGTCRLFETWDTRVSGNRWRAGSGATWSLTSNAVSYTHLTLPTILRV